MFADVSGSSSLYKLMGNEGAKARVDATLVSMTRITEEHRGVLVKTIGDEIMVYFADASQAGQAAQVMQRTLSDPKGLLPVRIGMAYGDTLLENGDIFGETVNDAAYLTHIARAGQILITQGFYDVCCMDLQFDCHEFDRISLKGEATKRVIYRLGWENETNTNYATKVMSIDGVTSSGLNQALTLVYGDHQHRLTPELTPFVLGRDPSRSDLHVQHGLASREHCQILFRRGKYVLIDHSTNGTYVTNQHQQEIYLRREEVPLQGEGTISIGQPLAGADDNVIRFFHPVT
jgi:hypothetical protein